MWGGWDSAFPASHPQHLANTYLLVCSPHLWKAMDIVHCCMGLTHLKYYFFSKQELYFSFISPSTHQFNRNRGFSENLLQMIPNCLFSHSTYITLQKLLNYNLNNKFHLWMITRKWLQYDLILISFNCNDPMSESHILRFWGLWLQHIFGGSTIQLITPSSGFVVFLYCIFDFQFINSQTYLYYCLLSSSSFRLHLLIIF